jgi:hypothetical protein
MEEGCIGSHGSKWRVVLDKEKDGKMISNQSAKIMVNY